jgi:hypothetical protein
VVDVLQQLSKALAAQLESNRSALGHERYFAEHRARLTREIETRAPVDRTLDLRQCRRDPRSSTS